MGKLKLVRLRALAPAALWAAAIFAASSMPGDAVPQVGFPGVDKLVHALLYGGLGLLLMRGLRGATTWSAGRAMMIAGVVSIAYGVSDEFHQWFVPHRSPDPFDVVADAVGAVIGAGAGRILDSGRRDIR